MASIKDLKRMCNFYGKCDGCPVSNDGYNCRVQRAPCYISDNIVDIVDKWVAEHPPKTYAQDFFEKFPNVRKVGTGQPCACRKNIYGNQQKCSSDDCYACWNEVMPE